MSDTIESLLAEGRTFPPPQSFKKDALVVDAEIYDEANADFEGFWTHQAFDLLDWFEEWHTILEWELPFAKWFVGGKLNASYNCLDRHVAAGRGDKVAYHWEGEPGDPRTITYAQLLDEVSRLANALVADVRDHVGHTIGPIAKPRKILFTEDLPKTQSGKIMRRLLRDVAEDQERGDTTTLADPAVEGSKTRYLTAATAEDE